jgi:nicotinamide-nucleotide amidase
VSLPDHLIAAAEDLLRLLRARHTILVTAESCTGGLLAALVTEIPGSSHAFERGFITYSNEAKMELLGVGRETLARHGAVSAETARAMAAGALEKSNASIAVSITGIAGPGGGTIEKPVGLVFLACMHRSGVPSLSKLELGNISRSAIRLAAVANALKLVEQQLDADQPER